MPDTIEWLQAIGQNASLRHATTDELAKILARGHASEALQAAVTAGDSALLCSEFGENQLHLSHSTKAPGHEEEDDCGHQDEREPAHPSSKPERDERRDEPCRD